jgi:hypothetical protein
VALVEECPANNNHPNKKNKLTQPSTMKCLASTKKPPPNKSEKLSEEKPSKSILTKEETQTNSKESQTLIKHSQIPKKDNCTMNTGNKEFKMVAHPEEVVEWAIFSVSSMEEDKEIPDPKRPSQSLLKSKLPSTMFTLAA